MILRKQQDAVLKTPPPPKGKWMFEPDPVQPEWHPPADSKPAREETKQPVASEPKKEPEPVGAGK